MTTTKALSSVSRSVLLLQVLLLTGAAADNLDIHILDTYDNGTVSNTCHELQAISSSDCFKEYWARHSYQFDSFTPGLCPTKYTTEEEQNEICGPDVVARIMKYDNNNNNNNNIQATSTCPTVEIAPNVHMPLVSLGHPDGPSRGGNATINETQALELWLSSKVNGVGIDTAMIYQNQDQVGAAMKKSGRSRSSMFLVTKIPNVLPRQQMMEAVRTDIKQLGGLLPDVVLIHTPCSSGFVSHGCVPATESEIQDAWLGMMDVLAMNLTKSIGVSNFNVQNLQPIIQMKDVVVPSINQCAMSVGSHDDETISYCAQHSIQYEAYSPLGRGKLNVSDPRIVEIASNHNGMSVYQVCLRWIAQQNIPFALSSTTLSHDLSDLLGSCSQTDMLTAQEMSILSNI